MKSVVCAFQDVPFQYFTPLLSTFLVTGFIAGTGSIGLMLYKGMLYNPNTEIAVSNESEKSALASAM